MKLYFIEPNPELNQPILLNLDYLTEGAYGYFLDDEVEVKRTGDFKDIKELKNYLEKADVIYLMGELDQSSYFEMGVCQGLGKTIRIVDDSLNFNSQMLNLNMELDLDVVTIPNFFK